MSPTPTATATATALDAPQSKPGKKKLLIIIAIAVLALVLVGGGLGLWLLKSKPEVDEDSDDATTPTSHAAPAAKHEAKTTPPVFLPIEPFTVNLADKDGERFAQIAVTLEIEDSHFGDQLRLYMPAIRNNILMAIAQKTAADLLSREGKELLARQILRESLRPLGITVAEPDDANADDPAAKKKGKRGKKAAPTYPIRSVQFASFIIQ